LIQLARGYGPAFVLSILNTTATTFTAALSGMAALNQQAGRIWSTTIEVIERMREVESWSQLLEAADSWLDSMGRNAGRDWEQLTGADEWQEISATDMPVAEDAGRRFEILAGSLMQMAQRRRGDSDPGENEIPVYTIHQSKGLQATHVYLLGASATAFLDSGTSPADGVRKLYVGLTRSRHSLSVSVGRWIQHRHFALHQRLGVNAVELSPHIAEAAQAQGIPITIVR
jgi:superfamily I DNA/RNA helicase